MNADIRIYPDKEMYAVDMAELMHASIPESGVLQGCALEFVGGNVTIQPGRLAIKGRLAVVLTEGIIEPSELVASNQVGHICAICNLSDQNEEYVKLQILPQNSYDAMVLSAQAYETGDHGDTFNVANGVALLDLGTITMTPSGLQGPLTLSDAGKGPKNVRTYVEEKESTLNTLIDNRYDKGTHRYNFLFNFRHSSSKFRTWVVTLPQRTIAAGKRGTWDFDCTYGVSLNNNLKPTYAYKDKTYTETSVTDKMGGTWRTSFKTFSDYGPQFLVPIAVGGMSINNASSNGKNADSCCPVLWYVTSGKTGKIAVVNNGKEAAVVDISLRVLYVQTE